MRGKEVDAHFSPSRLTRASEQGLWIYEFVYGLEEDNVKSYVVMGTD